ncbi:hypothetical protein BDV34DRAFT_113174 [Aspergillus parasiticus]|uniref:Uncharacterized protein n=1 Tax=Aspergillus parasiticus TaxID=5067 RepID=A0A5N6DHY2_ASPPA|nr:hypothetical protein BDV34DRAFT_113174 [Aspergillus parasiticus]
MKTSQMQHQFANLAGACNPHASMMPTSLVQFQVDEWNGRVLLAGTGSEQMLDLHWPTERLQLKVDKSLPYLTHSVFNTGEDLPPFSFLFLFHSFVNFFYGVSPSFSPCLFSFSFLFFLSAINLLAGKLRPCEVKEPCAFRWKPTIISTSSFYHSKE